MAASSRPAARDVLRQLNIRRFSDARVVGYPGGSPSQKWPPVVVRTGTFEAAPHGATRLPADRAVAGRCRPRTRAGSRRYRRLTVRSGRWFDDRAFSTVTVLSCTYSALPTLSTE